MMEDMLVGRLPAWERRFASRANNDSKKIPLPCSKVHGYSFHPQ
jgi:hypothetical protein